MADDPAVHGDGIGWATGGGRYDSVPRMGRTCRALRVSWVHQVLHEDDPRIEYLVSHGSTKQRGGPGL